MGSPHYSSVLTPWADCVRHLAATSRTNTAFVLAGEVLSLDRAAEEQSRSWASGWKSKFSDWSYGQILDQIVPALLDGDAARTVGFLLDLLAATCREAVDESEWAADHFRVWRPRLKKDELPDDVTQALLSIVRDTCVKAREDHLLQTAHLLDMLLARNTRLFHRLASHALLAPPLPERADLRRVLLCRDAFFESEPSPEYRELLTRGFSRLSAADRRQVLEWIEAGPPAKESRQDDRDYADIWRIRRLSLLEDDLPKAWRSRLDALVAAHGRHEIGTSFEVFSHTGPTSPLTSEELAGLSDDNLLETLSTYETGDGWFGPSREGLARMASVLAEESPERFCRLASRTASLRPVYLFWILHGLEQAVRKGKSVDWRELAGLFEAVSRNGDAEDIQSSYDYEEGRWRDVRKAIADLLVLAFESVTSPAPTDLKERLWTILEMLTQDPEPNADYEATYGGENMDPATLALNTVRGRAMQGVVVFAMWVKRRLEEGSGEFLPSILDEVPEVKRVIEAHLQSHLDASVAVRSVYGQYFPWILQIDEAWAAGLVPQIFPADHDHEPLRRAAWEAYLVWNRAYDSCFRILQKEYDRAVAEPESEDCWAWHGSTDSSRVALAKHLLTFYCRGLLDLGSNQGTLRLFFSSASEGVRARAIAGLGSSFRSVAHVEDSVLTRLERFWSWRLQENRRDGGLSKEIGAFGWWLPCECFSTEWRS